MEKDNRTLIFVYNADAGLFNTVTDIAHKIFSPATYSCNLCAITHSYFSMQKEWKAFLDEVNLPMELLHRDEFHSAYAMQDTALPVILIKQNNELHELLSAEQINQADSIDALKALIQAQLKE